MGGLEVGGVRWPGHRQGCQQSRLGTHVRSSHQIPDAGHALPPVPEEKYLTLEGFHKFVIDRAKQDVRSVWRAILSCGYDLHFER